MKFNGHRLRDNEFMTNIIEGKVLDKRGRGRTNKSYLEDIKLRDMKIAALERKMWLRLQVIAFRV